MISRRYISIFRKFKFDFLKKAMTGDNIQSLEAKAVEAEALAAELRSELNKLQSVVSALKLSGGPAYQDLKKENEFLKKEIERYKAQLTGRSSNASIVNSCEIPVQVSKSAPTSEKASKEKSPAPNKVANEKSLAPNKIANEKSPAPDKVAKDKVAKEKKPAAEKSVEEPPVDVGRLDLRVGKIVEVKKHPDADSLYVEQVDVGEAKPRTVVSGLVKHVSLEEMQNRMVIVLCNLKPAKMRGVTSEGMVMCASTPEKVEILAPPEGSVPGDVIDVTGFQRAPDSVLNPKKKIFETVAPELLTNKACVATYRGVPWTVAGRGEVTTKSLAGVNIK